MKKETYNLDITSKFGEYVIMLIFNTLKNEKILEYNPTGSGIGADVLTGNNRKNKFISVKTRLFPYEKMVEPQIIKESKTIVVQKKDIKKLYNKLEDKKKDYNNKNILAYWCSVLLTEEKKGFLRIFVFIFLIDKIEHVFNEHKESWSVRFNSKNIDEFERLKRNKYVECFEIPFFCL